MSGENRAGQSDTARWLSDQPKTWHEVNRALQDISVLLQYLGEMPDARLLAYFEDTQKHASDPGTRPAVAPCPIYSEFLNRLFRTEAAFQTGRPDELPVSFAPSPGEKEGLSPVGFVFWSRDFLSAVAAPATAESIRMTSEYVVRRTRTRWLQSILRPGRHGPTPLPAAPLQRQDPDEDARKRLARKLAGRVQMLEYLTIVAVVLTVCVSIYALSGRLILANEQDMENAWSNIDTQVEAQEDKIFKAATLPLAPGDRASVSSLCDMPILPQDHEVSYQVAANTQPDLAIGGVSPPSEPRYVSAHQAHLCANRAKVLLNLFVVTMHLQSWGSTVTQGLGKLHLPVAPLFGVMPSTLKHFAAEDEGSLCLGIRPSFSKMKSKISKAAECETLLWDEINRSRNVAQAILGSITLYLLPVLYGFLGAMAAAMRTLRRKVDASLLSYTDRTRIMQGAVLGILCGGVIGLFATSIGKADAVGGLGISALALIAGYNVDGVFRFLDELSDRLFRPGSPSSSGRPA